MVLFGRHQPHDAGTNTYLRLYIPFQFCRIDTREDANIHKKIACKYPSNSICTVVGEWHHGSFCLGYFLSSTHLTSSEGWLGRCGGSVFWFLGTIVTIMLETASVSLRTLAFFFPLLTDTFSSFNATCFLSILEHCSCFNSPVPGVKVSNNRTSHLVSNPSMWSSRTVTGKKSA